MVVIVAVFLMMVIGAGLVIVVIASPTQAFRWGQRQCNHTHNERKDCFADHAAPLDCQKFAGLGINLWVRIRLDKK